MKFELWTGLSAGILVLLSIPTQAQEAQPRDTGPKSLFITYKCPPAKRIAFRELMQTAGLARFEGWKKQGILEDYRLLFNSYVDRDTWDMMSMLTFPQYRNQERWREIERSMPGGLTRRELALASPVNTYLMDLSWQGTSATVKSDPARSVFFVIPYVYHPTPLEEYIKYVNGYVIPQAEGWVKEGVLASYRMYLNRYPTSRPWQSLLVLEFKDQEVFGQREKTVAKVRAELRRDPAWKAFSDSKESVRVEKETTIAEQLESRPVRTNPLR